MTLTLFAEPADETPEIPVPPLRLRRIRLQGVGPDGARFDPLDLDFTTRGGAAARVLLSLTNTGGKSTLITLVCSLIVPNARAQVGGKVLGDYVLTGDTSHVVCEWEDATTGRRTVTGTVMEWKDGRRQPPHSSRSTSNMHRAWYLFHTAAGVAGIDDLPFIVDGRRLPYRDFYRSVDDLIAGDPGMQGVITDKQPQWKTALEDRTSVDPTLFGYQMRMNDSEAGAEKLLASFDSPDNVVRFFVAALNDQRELETFTAKLAEYSTLAARRGDLEDVAGFGVEIVPKIDILGARAADADGASATARQVRMRGGEHAAAVANRVEQDEQSLVDLVEQLTEARAKAQAARRAYGQISDIRQQLLLEDARARVVFTEEAIEDAKRKANKAQKHAQAWQAVDLVIDLAAAREKREAAKLAYEAAEAGLQPLRRRTSEAASQVAGRLDALIAEAAKNAQMADVAAEQAAESAKQAREDAEQASLRLQKIEQELETIDRQVGQAEKACAKAVSARWLEEGENPALCLRRWQDVRGEAIAAAERAEAAAGAADTVFQRLNDQIDTLDSSLLALRATAQEAAAKVNEFDTYLAAVGDNETVVQLVGDRPTSPEQLTGVVTTAEQSARAADERAQRHAARARAAREELAQLDEAGTAPAGPDALAVQAALTKERIGAVTGLTWIERNITDPAQRPLFIARNPELAGGVIISDPARFTEGVSILRDTDIRTRTPVVVTTAPKPTSGPYGEVVEFKHVVVPHRATWDREWAERTRSELEGIERTESRAAADATDAAARYRDAKALCSDFVRRWGDTSAEELSAASAKAAKEVADTDSRREDLAKERADEWARAQEARREGQKQRRNAATADRNVAEASRLADITEDAAVAASRRDGLDAKRTRTEEEQRNARNSAAIAQQEFKAQTQQASDARSVMEVWRRERAVMGVDEAAPDPGGNLEVLRDSWTELRNELAGAEQGMTEAGALNDAEKEVSKVRARRDRFEDDVLAEAEFLATTTAASAQTSRTGAQQRAATAAEAAHRQLLKAESEHEQACDRLRETEPTGSDRQNFIDLSTTDWAPDRPEEIPGLLERLDTRNEELREQRDRTAQAEEDAQELHKAVSEDIESFTDTLGLWIADRRPTPRVFVGGKTQARDLMRKHVQDQRGADEAERRERQSLQLAVNDVRAVALSPRWAGLEAPAAMRVRSLSDPDLIAEVETLARRIRAMAESAAADLSELDEHRAILRDSLLSLCRDQRRMLREVTRYSKLPDGLGDLSHQPAILIRFQDAQDDEAAGRLATRIDTWAVELSGNPKRAKSPEVRARWLADAVRDTVLDRTRAGAWSIEILKPSIDGRVVYCPPDRIPIEFSGGQVLTLAVLVYCALSRVRSVHRQGGPRPPGTLLLDNPFGAASAEALIEMQHRLAAHSRVQLICATGLHDPAVDAAFTGPGSVIMKLRNDGDLRRNLSYLRLRATVVDGVDVVSAVTHGRDRASTRNWVDATRYEVRE